MRQIELYVPRWNNDGKAIPRKHWDSLEADILVRFGGFTRYSACGEWIDPKQIPSKTHHDMVTIFRIITTDNACTNHDIKDLAEYVKKHWQQESVLFTTQDIGSEYI